MKVSDTNKLVGGKETKNVHIKSYIQTYRQVKKKGKSVPITGPRCPEGSISYLTMAQDGGNDTIWNRTSELPICSTTSVTTALPPSPY